MASSQMHSETKVSPPIIALSNSQQFSKEMSKYTYFELPNVTGNEKFNRKYLAHENGESIVEIAQIQGEKSLFVGNYVNSSTSMLTMIEVDPVLLSIPLLNSSRGIVSEEKKGYFKQLDEIFATDEHSSTMQQKETMNILMKNKRLLRGLKNICDFQNHSDDPAETYYRLNNDKLTSYLNSKIDKAQVAFSKYQDSLQFQKMSTKETITDALYFGLEFVHGYLSPELFYSLVLQPRQIQLDEFINFKLHAEKRSAYDYSEDNPESKESAKKKKEPNAPPKITTAELKNIQAAKNSKPISSFFVKKQK